MSSLHFGRLNYCIKTLEPAPAPAEPTRTAKDDKAKPAKKGTVPAHLRNLPIFIDPEKLVMAEIEGHKTDNSNTQFAILALWAAQRYDVPMDRTLRLLVRRFQVSQNPLTGSWDYPFAVGGTNEDKRPQMTAVGLLGLAVGHGLAAPARGAGVHRQAKDPAILKGFVALSKHIGRPTGQWQGHAQPNLYYLWSLERVAVLYNLERIADKDWYRWGAEVLVANQQPAGNWQNGQYWGSSPVLDTCLALLFLQRANLARDLAEKLPFNPGDLNTAVTDQAKKEADKATPGLGLIGIKTTLPTEASPAPVDRPITTESPDQTAEKKEEEEKNPEPEQKSEADRNTSPPAAELAPKRKVWPYVLLGLGALLLLGGGVFLVVYLGGESAKQEEKPRPKKRLARKDVSR
jgi:hypothetical protein